LGLTDDQALVSPAIGLLVLIEESHHAIHEELVNALDLLVGGIVTLCDRDRLVHDSKDGDAVRDGKKETAPEENESEA
jgi:hypothetical protein